MKFVSLEGLRGLDTPAGVELLVKIDVPEPFLLPAPKVVQGHQDSNRAQVDEAFTLARMLRPKNTYIAVLRDVMVSPQGLILDRDGSAIYESVFPWQLENYQGQFKDLAPGEGVTVRELPEAYHCREGAETGYFHFINSVIPRLGLRRHLNLSENTPTLLNTYRPFAREVFGWQQGLVIDGDKSWTRVERLFYPSPMMIEGNQFTRSVFGTDTIRRVFGSALQWKGGERRIYLSRRDAEVRRLVNEDELVTFLCDKHGFEVYSVGDAPMAQQCEVFNGANVLVSVHGAGLSNMVLMNKGSSVLEIVSPTRLWPTFRCLAGRAGQSYSCLVGADVVKGETLEGNEDFHVDMGIAKKTINYFINGSLAYSG